MTRRTILITGASGKLGSALVHSLSGTHQIVQLDLEEPTAAQRAIGPFHTGSITDPMAVAAAMDGVDTVIHAGAIPWSLKPYHLLIRTNVMGTFVLLEQAGVCGHVEQFIYISSIMMHGLCNPRIKLRLPDYLPIDEDHASKAVDLYPCTKAQAEFWCRNYVERFGKPCIAIRPPLIITLDSEGQFEAQPVGEQPSLHEYIGTSDLLDAITRALDYHPLDGFDRFLVHAADQRSTMPSMEIAERFFP
ncbi:MAG: NAD-dependent epimerase/dehydratase family protein, partial [Nitrospiraceae bacterium]|nr:NAD-dependent epimerase/dehydratase family protein [Nitrospiraceae bacterium]